MNNLDLEPWLRIEHAVPRGAAPFEALGAAVTAAPGLYDQPGEYGLFEHDRAAPIAAAAPHYTTTGDSINEYDDEGRIIEKVRTKGQYGQECGRSLLCTCKPAWFKDTETGVFYCEGCALDENRRTRREVCKRL